jgi:periplasmic protein TonB
MFEHSLMESGKTHPARSKYWPFISLLVNGTGMIVLIVWPLLHPEALPTQMIATLMVAPSPPPLPPRTAPAPKVHTKSEILNAGLQAPSRIPTHISTVKESATPPSLQATGIEDPGSGTPRGIGNVLDSIGIGPPIVVKEAPTKPLPVSRGLMAGNLLSRTLPQYPATVRAMRIQGVVVLQATISKTGSIENLRVVSGPPMLRQAAIDAVQTWRYKPYLLIGDPVEVETTINVVFNLGE